MDNTAIITEHLQKSREVLFELSKQFMSSDTIDFGKAQACFELAKRAEVLRRDVMETFNGSKGRDFVIDSEVAVTGGSAKTLAKTPRGPKKKKQDYPKYIFRNGNLVKIGLRRDERSEYEHTVEYSNLAKVLESINTIPKDKDFGIPEVLDGLAEIPDYQVYVVVARLRQLGILKTPRKGVYKFRSTTQGLLSESDLAVPKA